MKTKPSGIVYPLAEPQGLVMNDRAAVEPEAEAEAMIRTQVYLTRAEHEFLQAEAERRGETMAAFLRRIIDERMKPAEDAWISNPMLEPTPDAAGWSGAEDASLNHDHYVYGSAKKYEKQRGKWVLQPPTKE